MSESSDKVDQVKNPSRRRFLIRAVKMTAAGVGATALGGILANEVINKSEGNIVTESGIFFPLYERHDKGIKLESIHLNLDVFFRETGGMDTFSRSPEEVLRQRFQEYNGIPAFPDKVLAFLSKSKAEVMIGDADMPIGMGLETLIAGGEIIVGAGVGVAASEPPSKYSSDYNKVYSEAEMGRRKFLKVVMLAGAAWGLAKLPLLPGLLLEPYNKNVIDRIYYRLTAIDSHMHPELSMIFFRSLMMAEKLLTVSEDIRERTGQKAKIAFNVGVGHAGIEDFLQAGHDFCRGLILAYPKWYLKSIVELNNGIRVFSSSRLFKLPENLTSGDIASGERLKETTERRVVNERLEKALTLKLA